MRLIASRPSYRGTAVFGLTSLVLGVASIAAHAQVSKNCQLLAEVKPSTSPQFNDVWGYVDPATGRECAILGGTAATYIVETTNPTAPVVRGTFTQSSSGWSTSIWSDMKAWKGYAYVVTDGVRPLAGGVAKSFASRLAIGTGPSGVVFAAPLIHFQSAGKNFGSWARSGLTNLPSTK